MKPTELQKKVCEHIITEVKYWMNSNDITSPTHYSDLNDCLFIELEDDLTEYQITELEINLRSLLNLIKNIEKK